MYMSAANNRTLNFLKQKVKEQKGEIDMSTSTTGNLKPLNN